MIKRKDGIREDFVLSCVWYRYMIYIKKTTVMLVDNIKLKEENMERGAEVFRRVIGVVLAIVLCMTLAAVEKPMEVQAASGLGAYKQVSFYKAQRIGNTVYSMKYNDRYRNYTIYMRRNGKTKALVRDCSGGSFVTNGKVIYYTSGTFYSEGSLGWNYKNMRIRQYLISSGKSRTLLYRSGPMKSSAPIACDGAYLYFGSCTQYGGAYRMLEILNLKNRRVVSTKYDVSDVRRLNNGKLLISATGFPHGGSLAIMNRNGSGRKLITRENVTQVSVKGKYIYYTETKYSWESRKCRCDLNGNNRKALTKWSDGVLA